MRQALHELLKRVLAEAQVPVRLGTTVSSLQQSEDGLDVQFTDGAHGHYDLVVGADGANSKMPEMLFGEEARPQYTGQAAWRATVARPADVQGRCSYFGPRNKAGFNPVSQRQMYIYLVQNFRCSCGLPTPSFRRSCASSSWILAEWEKVSDMPSADPAGVLDRTLKTLAQPF
jgi:2-polyprenyl-6-methoxyphenol hydroxylase-like FAD-dependent oxidoreductase